MLVVVTGYAVSTGDRLVRRAAAANAANWLVVNALQPRIGAQANAVVFPWGQFFADALFASAFLAMAVTTRRTWLALMAAFLLLGVANYASYLGELHRWHRALVTTAYLWGFGALACLAAGAWESRRVRERRELS